MTFMDSVEFLITSTTWLNVRQLASTIPAALLSTGSRQTPRNPVGFWRQIYSQIRRKLESLPITNWTDFASVSFVSTSYIIKYKYCCYILHLIMSVGCRRDLMCYSFNRAISFTLLTRILLLWYPIPFWNGRAISAGGVSNFAPFLPLNWLPWQLPLRYRKKRVGLIICNAIPTIWCKDCKNWSSRSWDTSAPSEQVCYDTKLVAMTTSLEILKKNFGSIIYTQKAFIWCKNCKNRAWFVFFLVHKIGCHGNVPWAIGKNGPDWQHSHKYLSFGEKIVKISPVDPEIALFNLKKKKEINASKIYSQVSRFAERAKLVHQFLPTFSVIKSKYIL